MKQFKQDLQEPLPGAFTTPCNTFQQDHPGKRHSGKKGTKVAMSRDSSGRKSWCSKRALQMTEGGREGKVIANHSL